MLRLGKALFLSALVVGPGTAHAAGWLAPQDLSLPVAATKPQIAIDASGKALSIWEGSDGTGTRIYASDHDGGVWQAPKILSVGGNNNGPQVAFDSARNAVAVWSGIHDGINYIVQASARPAGGNWEPPKDLSAPGQGAFDPQVAVDPAGNAVAVWSRWNGSEYIVQSAVRPVGGAWQAPQNLSAVGGGADFPQVAVNSGGDAVAVWQRFNGADLIVQASVRLAGSAWQAAQDLSAVGQTAALPQVALDSDGNAVAVWQRSNGMHTIVQAARRPAGGPWQPPQNLSAAGQNAIDPAVAVDGAGNAEAFWARSNGANFIVQASRRPAGGVWEPAKDLSAPGGSASLPQVSLGSGGSGVAVWKRLSGGNYIIQGAVRPGGGEWQPGLDLSAAGVSADWNQVALDSMGNAVAIWMRSSGPSTIIQAAPYDATAPVLRVAVPARGFARQRLTFSADAFDTWSPLGPPLWNFGDGKSASGLTVTHTYAKRGTYTVMVNQADAVANETTAARMLTLRVARCFGRAATRVGSSGKDRIRGTRRADVIVALGGADRVRGRGGNDKICGGKGRDRLVGGGGNDLLNGGPGRDICSQGKGRGRLVAC